MMKFQPIGYLNSAEIYFPAKVADLGINWAAAKMGDTTVSVTYTYKGPSSFDVTAPMLVSILENSDGTARISYVFFYGYNGCGPKADIYAELIGLKVNEIINLCPADLHWGDIEHIEVTLASGYNSVKQIKYAYHQWSKTYTADGTLDGSLSSNVKFDGTHPYVYFGNGSHASYSTPGDQEYLTLFSKKGTGYNAWGKFIDYAAVEATGHRWTGYARLLKLNGAATSDITADENYLAFKYYGALGGQINNTTANDLVSVLDKIKDVASKLSLKSLKKDIESAISELDDYYEATAVSGLANPSRTWW